MRKWLVWLAAAAIALGLFVLAYRGPGRAVIRGHVGDIAAAMLVYALVAAIAPNRGWWPRAAVTLGIACAIELGQAVWSTSSTLGALTIGDTCDPWDFLAYAAGVVTAVIWERIAVARGTPCASPP